MAKKNRGKQFEDVVKEAFKKVPGVSIDRVHDQTTGYKGSTNICDFIVYREPYEYYIECKSVHGKSLPFKNITETQWYGMLEKSDIEGVIAGVIVWYIDLDKTYFFHIRHLQYVFEDGHASIKCPGYSPDSTYLHDPSKVVPIRGKKKRVFFDYDMEEFLDAVQYKRWTVN